MPNPDNEPQLPKNQSPIIDDRTGLVSRDWYRFFLNLLNRTGTGTVTSVNVSGGTTGLTTSGGPVTTSGTITLAGTLDVDNGGTGATTASGARTNLGAAASGTNADITSMTGVTGGISTPDFIQFDTTATVTDVTGKLYYDPADQFQTLAFQMNGAVVQHVGENQFYRVKCSGAITKGQVVMFAGAVGASGGLIGAAATGLTANQADYILGLAGETGANNDWITVYVFGEVKNIDTTGGAETWVQGDELYYNPLVTGGLTKTKPTTPAAIAKVAAVVHVGVANGILFVRPSYGSLFGGMDGDVLFGTLASGNTIIYDATAGVWKNANLTDGTAISITEGPGSITIANTGVTSAIAGTGISVSSATGDVTFTNTAPDQTVVLTGGTGISTSGTYPSFTITNTGVTSFNTRTGDVTLSSSDVTTALTYTPVNKAGDTMTGKLNLPVVTTAAAPINIDQGATTTAPTTPVNGDVWINATNGLQFRVNGATRTAAALATAQTFSALQTFSAGITCSIGAVTFNQTASAITLGAATSTGTITVGQTTGASQTVNIQSGALTSGFTKTINIGANGLSGSTTTMVIGSANGTTATANGSWTFPNTITGSVSGTASNVTGTVAVANGGTGLTGIAALSVPVANTLNTYTAVTGTAGQSIRVNAGGTAWEAYTPASGTVTSVTGTSPVVSSGGTAPAISLASGYGDTQNPYASKTANFVLAAPNGIAGVPTFRAIVAADIPTLNQNTTGTASNVTGTVAIANGGTGQTTQQTALNAIAGAVTSGSYLRGNGTNVVMSAIQAADVPTLNQNTTGSAATLTTGRTISITGDLAYTSPSFNGSANVTAAGTLATVNLNVGSFTNASITVNGKGLITAASSGTAPVTSVTGTSPVVSSGGATPAISLASGYGDTQNPYASKTANFFLAAPNGVAGVPTFRAVVAADIPTLNQNTTGTASNVTGTVAIANGGTGQTTKIAAFDALSPVTTKGDLIVGDGTDNVRLPVGADGLVLQADSTQTTGLKWAAAGSSGATITNDTATSTNVYPTFTAATSGTLSTIYTSNAKLLYKPSTGELTSEHLVAGNGIFVNSLTIDVSYTIAAGTSGMSAGPVTVASGTTVTVASGSRWVVV